MRAAQMPIPALLLNVPLVELGGAAGGNASTSGGGEAAEAEQPESGPDAEAALLPGGVDLRAPMQLWGPFNDDPAQAVPTPVLRAAAGRPGALPLFVMSGDAHLFINRLVRAGHDGCSTAPRPLPPLAVAAVATSPGVDWSCAH